MPLSPPWVRTAPSPLSPTAAFRELFGITSEEQAKNLGIVQMNQVFEDKNGSGATVTVKEAPKKDLVLRSIYQSEGTAQDQFTMHMGDPAVPMTVDGTDSTVKWSTEHSSIATINSDGEVTAVSLGRTTIIAEVDGQTLKCEVLVQPIDSQ